jgi:hypothetical protein
LAPKASNVPNFEFKTGLEVKKAEGAELLLPNKTKELRRDPLRFKKQMEI